MVLRADRVATSGSSNVSPAASGGGAGEKHRRNMGVEKKDRQCIAA